jgi:hypothetical protein
MNHKFLTLFLTLVLTHNFSDAQVLGKDTTQYRGRKNYGSGDGKTIWVSRLCFYPDSAYKKADYYYMVGKSKKIHINVSPSVDTGYWILKGKNIYLFSDKDFIGNGFKGKFRKGKNTLKYRWNAFLKQGGKKNNIIKTNTICKQIYGVRPIRKFKMMKLRVL